MQRLALDVHAPAHEGKRDGCGYEGGDGSAFAGLNAHAHVRVGGIGPHHLGEEYAPDQDAVAIHASLAYIEVDSAAALGMRARGRDDAEERGEDGEGNGEGASHSGSTAPE